MWRRMGSDRRRIGLESPVRSLHLVLVFSKSIIVVITTVIISNGQVGVAAASTSLIPVEIIK